MSKKETAMQNFSAGMNCSQAVACAFAEEIGLPSKKIMTLASGFGGGVGRMREVCGAVSGAVFVLSSIYGDYEIEDKQAKIDLYAKIQEFAKRFKERNRYIVCAELMGITKDGLSSVPEERNAEFFKKRPCLELVGDSAEILEKYLDELRNS